MHFGGSGRQGQCFRHHDNAPSHTACCAVIPRRKNIPITQPSYSQDLDPSYFWLFPAPKMGPKWTCFITMVDIKSNATGEPQEIPKEAFR
jgi:hypothetical protein